MRTVFGSIGARTSGAFFLIWLITSTTLVLPFLPVSAEAVPAADDTRTGSDTVLLFFHVRDGKIMKKAYHLRDLFETPVVEIDGYVAGIVVFSEAETDILLKNSRMRRLEENADGTLSLDYFGRFNPKEFWDQNLADSTGLQGIKRPDSAGTSGQKYAILPETVLLDTVSADDRFKVLFRQDDSSFELTVNHRGYRDVQRPRANDWRRPKTALRYLGNRAEVLENASDFGKRVDAIVQGIALVERTFGLDLVEYVNLVDCEGLRNALTRAGMRDIWFFIETFQHETITELKTIAIHETLHLLVDHYQLTRDHEIRKLFADLKGYDELSLERFFLLTRGTVKRDATFRAGEHVLFSFIDEKHFLGRKGGHSHQNLDEFCTSMLHSLMFLYRLDRNLSLPLKSGATAAIGNLTDRQKSEILDYYLRSIGIFQAIVSGFDDDVATQTFFKKKRTYIESLIDSRKEPDSSRRLQAGVD